MQKLMDGVWVDTTENELVAGDVYRVSVGGGWQQQTYVEVVESPIITITVNLSKTQCLLGESVDYTITFSEPITVPLIVPISVSDRNGNHITNIGCMVTNGVASGTFVMAVAGDFTVTDEAINYHRTSIEATLRLVDQPWLRVYQ